MADEEKEIELTQLCRIYLDPATRTVRAECPSDIIDKAAEIKPKRIVFELTEEEKK